MANPHLQLLDSSDFGSGMYALPGNGSFIDEDGAGTHRSAVIDGLIAGAPKTIKYECLPAGTKHGQVSSLMPDMAGQVRSVSIFDDEDVNGTHRLVLLVFFANKVTGKDNDSAYFAVIEDTAYVPKNTGGSTGGGTGLTRDDVRQIIADAITNG